MDEISRYFFPGQFIPPSVDEDIEEMAGYSVKRTKEGRKVYESADETLPVWSVDACVKKLAKALAEDDINNIFATAATWQAAQAEKGKMHEQHAADCCALLEKVWNKYGYDVKDMVPKAPEEAPVETPPPPKKLGLFRKGA